ncbi:MAG: nitroreductase [Planctomycetes bacterium]|nr:nitroreductase [Planctomycetota bacterium]
MDVMEAIRTRRSIRAYLDKPVEEEKLKRVLEAARLAPSAKNMQEWKFIVVRDPATRQKLVEAAKGQKFVGEAPVVIAACGTKPDYVMSCGQLSHTVDVSIAVTHMCLQAVAEGLGTCWLGAFYEDQAKKILGVPDGVRIVALLPLGYPKESPAARPRKALGEIVCYDRWG